uniref:Uncharacterized protein n=1 Tax=Romanomermis culicivorax TaxID=13658 RepID=A0A915IW43_ROMCU
MKLNSAVKSQKVARRYRKKTNFSLALTSASAKKEVNPNVYSNRRRKLTLSSNSANIHVIKIKKLIGFDRVPENDITEKMSEAYPSKFKQRQQVFSEESSSRSLQSDFVVFRRCY